MHDASPFSPRLYVSWAGPGRAVLAFAYLTSGDRSGRLSGLPHLRLVEDGKQHDPWWRPFRLEGSRPRAARHHTWAGSAVAGVGIPASVGPGAALRAVREARVKPK
ncbi:hypothetical protein GCM10010331_65170 [Streptomyces xanthochromogenes]|nr:hypothetical protein GCM10010331_65170 [Streptomyces xanthochromogenes]